MFTLAVSITLPMSPASASATCSGGSRCYTYIEQAHITTTVTGYYGYLKAYCLSASSPSSYEHYATTEMYMVSSQGHSIESGISHGYPEGNARYFFWATVRPVGGDDQAYTEHDADPDTPALGTGYEVYAYGGLSDYYPSAGSYYGTSPGWPASETWQILDIGSETYPGVTANINSAAYELGYYNSAGSYHDGLSWGGYSASTYRTPSSWGYLNTVVTNSHYDYGTQNSC